MIKYVAQTCDWCGIEGKSVTLGVPEGWFVFDLRGGKEPGIVGYGWNVCSRECMNDCINEWVDGKNPLPYGVPGAAHDHIPEIEEEPIEYHVPHGVEPIPENPRYVQKRQPCGCGGHGKGSIDDIARASAERAPRTRRYMQTEAGMVEVLPPRERLSRVPVEQQGHGGH